jgi:inosine-uridine nucleoside N-ribohydrolase
MISTKDIESCLISLYKTVYNHDIDTRVIKYCIATETVLTSEVYAKLKEHYANDGSYTEFLQTIAMLEKHYESDSNDNGSTSADALASMFAMMNQNNVINNTDE